MLESIYTVFVPSGLIVLMLGMGMQLVPADWYRVVRYPRAIVAGLAGQFILLPAIAFLLVCSLSLPLSVSAGIVILAVCPGGVVSNSISFLARGDIPLSVTLTALSSVLALLSIPLVLDFGLDLVQRGSVTGLEDGYLELPVAATLGQLFVLVVLPLVSGMVIRRYASEFARRSEAWMRVLGVVVLLVLLVGSVALEYDFFKQNLESLWPVLLLFNLAALSGGYLLALALGIGRVQKLTITIEVGVQNVALGAMLALNILQRSEWAVVPSVYGIFMMSTAFALILLGNRLANPEASAMEKEI